VGKDEGEKNLPGVYRFRKGGRVGRKGRKRLTGGSWKARLGVISRLIKGGGTRGKGTRQF